MDNEGGGNYGEDAFVIVQGGLGGSRKWGRMGKSGFVLGFVDCLLA